MSIIVNFQNKEGRTAKYMAILGKVVHENILELLLSMPRLDINSPDKNEMFVVNILEMNLLSSISSDQLCKKLALASGKEMRP